MYIAELRVTLIVFYRYVAGVEIVRKALRMPCMTIAKNAGVDAAVVVSKVLDGSDDFGYDALNDEFVNMIERGIIDPTKVSYSLVWRFFHFVFQIDSHVVSSFPSTFR